MLRLAVRYLLSRKRQSLFTFFGIFLGCAGFVIISGLFVGFQDYLIGQLVNNSAHVLIQARDEFLLPHSLDEAFFGKGRGLHVFWSTPPAGRKDYARIESPQSWYQRLLADPKVSAFSPQMTVSALFSKARTTVSASIVGCLPSQETRVNSLESRMVEGKFENIGSGGNRIVVGRELLNQLGAKLYQNIQVAVGSAAPAPYNIVGVFRAGNQQAELQAYAALSDVQKSNQTAAQINQIAVRLIDYSAAKEVAANWGSISGEKVLSWDQLNSDVLSIFILQNLIRFAVVFVVMLVAGFGIYNVLMITVTHKLKDIAILGAMGYERAEISFLFLSQGLFLGLAGALFGVIAGYLACLLLQTVTWGGAEVSAGERHLHIALSFPIYAQAALLAILSAAVASYLPARAAGNRMPIEIIRGGAE